MELKFGEKVSYKGGLIKFNNLPDNTHEEPLKLAPISGTYVWKIIKGESNSWYLIQHDSGLNIESLKYIHKDLEGVDLSSLHQERLHIFVESHDLVSLENHQEEVEEDIPSDSKEETVADQITTLEEAATPYPNKLDEISVHDDLSEESLVDLNDSEKEPIENFILNEDENITEEVEQVFDINKPNIGLDYPHYTTQTCSSVGMVETVALDKLLWSKKIPEPFTVELPSGCFQEARGGDYLMLTQEKTIFIEPKETFALKYENKQDVTTKKIGTKGVVYILQTEVADYMSWLESQNKTLRDELYL